jgi:septal ring factor EnvC (AmiA/AmiB activator)
MIGSNSIAGILPWVALLGFFGLLLRVRVSGDPALWRRIEALEKKIDAQQEEMMREREECSARISDLEGKIRQLQQRERSLGNIDDDRPLAGVLRHAYPVEKDADLIRKLNRRKSVKKQ